MRGAYVLGCDVQNLLAINRDCGRAAGDLIIAGAFARIEEALSGDMLLFRIGGDEFAVVTGYTAREDAEALARALTARNGEPVTHGDQEIALSLRVGISAHPGTLNYREILERLYMSINEAKKSEDGIGFAE